MYFNCKLYFKYLLNSWNSIFLKLSVNSKKGDIIFVNKDFIYFTIIHLKLSSLFFLSQLTDIFSYETSTSRAGFTNDHLLATVYNFHLLNSNERLYLFTLNYAFFKKNVNLFSITELFPAANWLEREVSELQGVLFLGKQDLRNLLLQYGDSTAPFQKSFPTIGLHEVYYNPVKDTLVQQRITTQL